MEGKEFSDRHADRVRRRDFDDLQREIAGLEVGRQRRFRGGEDEKNPRTREGRQARQQAQLTALEIMLATDSAYRALYNDTMDQLRAAEIATETALTKAEAAHDQAKEEIQDILARAATLPDGARVFRDADGNVRREDGTLVSGLNADSIVWPEDALDYETFLARKEALEQAQQTIEDIRAYQVDVLGNARDRLTDPNDPPSKDDLRQIQRDIEEKNPAAQRTEHAVEPAADAEPPAPSSDTVIPPI